MIFISLDILEAFPLVVDYAFLCPSWIEGPDIFFGDLQAFVPFCAVVQQIVAFSADSYDVLLYSQPSVGSWDDVSLWVSRAATEDAAPPVSLPDDFLHLCRDRRLSRTLVQASSTVVMIVSASCTSIPLFVSLIDDFTPSASTTWKVLIRPLAMSSRIACIASPVDS